MESLRNSLGGLPVAPQAAIYKGDVDVSSGVALSTDDSDGFLNQDVLGGALGHIDRQNAIPAAYLAVALISGLIAMLPRRICRWEDDVWEPVDHPLQAVLDFPSRIIDPIQCWTMIARGFVARGNGYAWLRRDFATKRIVELVPAIATRSQFREARYAPYVEYELELLGGEGLSGVGRRRQKATSHNVLSFNGPGFNGLCSPSPIAIAASSMSDAMISTVSHYRSMLKSGLSSRNAIVVNEGKDARVSFQTWQQVAQRVRDDYTGVAGSGRIPTLPPGFDIKSLDVFSADDLKLIELLKWGVEDIARVFMISPVRLGHYHQSMRVKTFEQQAEDLERYTITPRTCLMDSQMSWKLLSPADQAQGLKIVTDTTKISMGTFMEMLEAAGHAVTHYSLMTPNEGRRMLHMPPSDDPMADELQPAKGVPDMSGSMTDDQAEEQTDD